MCHLGYEASYESFVGYKVVAVKEDGKKYSVAMGFCYDDYNLIPVVEKQESIGSYFVNDILNKYGCSPYKPNMRGRTAVFADKQEALSLRKAIERDTPNNISIKVFKSKYHQI